MTTPGPPDPSAAGQLAASRREAIDVARVLALVVVVLGHLLLAVIDRVDGEVRGANLLALHPGWAPVAVLAPMPVFFTAAGWANARSGLDAVAPRLRTLVGLGAVVVLVWSLGVVLATFVGGDPGVVGDGARIATQPLWFLAAYVPMAAAGAHLAGLAARRPMATVGGCLAALALVDLARFGAGAPDWVGWPGFYLAWVVPWLVGGWWRARHTAGGFDERRVGVRLAAAAVAGGVVLVALAGYDPALIDAVPDARSNTTPPTLFTATAALGQAGLLLVGAAALDRLGRRWRRLWDRAGEAAVGVYVWHLSALALCAAVIAAGLPVPERLTVTWWLTRPLWWASVLAVTAGFVALTAAARGRARSPARRRALDTAAAGKVLGVVAAAAGGAAVGLRGPRSVGLAAACSALFAASWWLLGRDGSAASARATELT